VNRHWLIANELDPDTPTCECSIGGDRQIDFICAYPKESFHVRSFRVVPEQTASDHCPVEAVLEIKK
jgi:endonuclease/exonuclease/phosphatase family metal-dependent hydrolase